jgi:hypothetical protein
MSLTREQILAARSKRKPVTVPVPEWGGDVLIRVLSAGDQATLASNGHPQGEMPVRILLATLVNEQGKALFGEEDVPALMEEEFPIILRVFAEAARLNGLSTKELEEAMASFGTAQERRSSSE